MSSNQGLYSKEVIANLLNLSERRVEQLVKQKIIPKAGRGVFDLGPTVQAYVRYLQGLCSGSIRNGESSELEQRLFAAQVLERESKARQAKCKADLMERELMRSDISLIPERLARKLTNLKIDPGIINQVNQEVRGLVNEIINPSKD